MIRKPIDIPSINWPEQAPDTLRAESRDFDVRMFNDLHDAMNLSMGKRKESTLQVWNSNYIYNYHRLYIKSVFKAFRWPVRQSETLLH